MSASKALRCPLETRGVLSNSYSDDIASIREGSRIARSVGSPCTSSRAPRQKTPPETRPRRLTLASSPLVAVWTERYRLSAAETVTLRLVLDGLRVAEIAERRRIARSTVKRQIGSLLSKVEAARTADIVIAFALELLKGEAAE